MSTKNKIETMFDEPFISFTNYNIINHLIGLFIPIILPCYIVYIYIVEGKLFNGDN